MKESKEIRRQIGDDTLILTTNHRYYLNEKKMKNAVVSVTSISKLLDKSDFLVPWATRIGYETALDELQAKTDWHIDELLPIMELARYAYKDDSEKAKEIGNLVHDYAEAYALAQIEGKPIPVVENQDQAVLLGITAFADFIKQLKPKFIAAEKLVLCRSEKGSPIYAGKLDAIATIDGKITLIDYKTGSNIYEEAVLQVAGYAYANDLETDSDKIEQAIICRFDKVTGKLSTQTYQANELAKATDIFMALALVRHSRKELEKIMKNKGEQDDNRTT